ncbi:YbjN domain-containing protein [Planktothricoides sp. SR001]|uniref:YbjN domain-containing protein n=1 Tax=Planktothricoides sp. SR001 TaxID=1705388 RepID=UPI00092FBEC8|nr:YbjN domain-containing protein [Planktothricoides sp. SR001]
MCLQKNKKVKTEGCHLIPDLVLHDSSGNVLRIQSVGISLRRDYDELTECLLYFSLSWEGYKQVKSGCLFYFNQDLQEAILTEDIFSDLDVEITTLLHPELLSELENCATNAKTVATYLQTLSQEQPAHSLLSTESWLILSIKQQQALEEKIYRTVWDYIDWSKFVRDEITEDTDDLLQQAVISFFKDSTASHLLAEADGEIDQKTVEATTQLIETLFSVSPSLVSQPEIAAQQVLRSITSFFQELLQEQLSTPLQEDIDSESTDKSGTNRPSRLLAKDGGTAFSRVGLKSFQQLEKTSTIFETVISFFKEENWSSTQLPGQSILHLYFEGENGEWECYALVREAEQQLVFYSLLPVKTPESKRQVMLEFLARANYGIIIGNFEIGFHQGEIRYKTSIDLENCQLNLPMIRQLVYSNLLNTDKYLPGIMAVINGKMSPEEAIAAIES